jgi:hypothetical protein
MEEIIKEVHYDGTRLSKFLNKRFLFDKTGRSITSTIMDGSSTLTNGRFKLSGDGAHAIMIAGTVCLFSKNKNLKMIGGITWLLLALTYIAGRKK